MALSGSRLRVCSDQSPLAGVPGDSGRDSGIERNLRLTVGRSGGALGSFVAGSAPRGFVFDGLRPFLLGGVLFSLL